MEEGLQTQGLDLREETTANTTILSGFSRGMTANSTFKQQLGNMKQIKSFLWLDVLVSVIFSSFFLQLAMHLFSVQTLQNFMYTMLRDNNAVAAKMSLVSMNGVLMIV